jgi:carbamoyl-phosphate synthase small subunit
LPATLALESGLTFRGRLFGSQRDGAGEVVFHTGMTGYQEILTDPSYAGQIVVFTAPHIGNYGIHAEDHESARIHPAAVIVRDICRRSFHRRAERSLDDLLRRAGTPGLSDADTRALTIALREGGSCRGVLGADDPDALVARARCLPPIGDTDWVALDFGIKRSILDRMAAEGCRCRVLPAGTPAAEILAGGHEGVFLSNGPGDPASLPHLVDMVRHLLAADLPLFGICLGHQLLARALGAETVRLPFGHHGANHPVQRLDDGRVAITSQNHNYAVPADSLDPGLARITHLSLNDGTVEGLELPGLPVYSVQFHPEAAPGPHDSHHLFRRFRQDMACRRGGVRAFAAAAAAEQLAAAAHESDGARNATRGGGKS